MNGLVEYSIVDSDEEKPQENGYGVFSINLPHQGAVTLNRTLDYERSQKYYVTIVASVWFIIMPLKIAFFPASSEELISRFFKNIEHVYNGYAYIHRIELLTQDCADLQPQH